MWFFPTQLQVDLIFFSSYCNNDMYADYKFFIRISAMMWDEMKGNDNDDNSKMHRRDKMLYWYWFVSSKRWWELNIHVKNV